MKIVQLLLLLACLQTQAAAHAQATFFNSRGDFAATLGASITDDYENPGYRPSQLTVLNDDKMTSVLRETRYTATYIPNWNIISTANGLPNNHFYCAGCNGTFDLTFTYASVGSSNGVFGVGFDIYDNHGTSSGYLPMRALINLGDGSTLNVQLPLHQYSSGADYVFFGITSAAEIASIQIVNSPNSSASFAIDNLTIGTAVPEPTSFLLLLVGMATVMTINTSRAGSRKHAPSPSRLGDA